MLETHFRLRLVFALLILIVFVSVLFYYNRYKGYKYIPKTVAFGDAEKSLYFIQDLICLSKTQDGILFCFFFLNVAYLFISVPVEGIFPKSGGNLKGPESQPDKSP